VDILLPQVFFGKLLEHIIEAGTLKLPVLKVIAALLRQRRSARAYRSGLNFLPFPE